MKYSNAFAIAAAMAALSLTATGCVSEYSFSPIPLVLAPEPVPPGPIDTGTTGNLLRSVKPALAVRGISCLLCHAKVDSNILTDFGYGDSKFFATTHPQFPDKPLNTWWYGNYFGAMQLAEIKGSVIIPKATITDPALLASLPGYSKPSITLAEMMQLDLGDDYYFSNGHSGKGSMVSGVTQKKPQDQKIVEVDQLYIGAPTAKEIMELTKNLNLKAPGIESIGPSSSISGLTLQSGNSSSSYITNSNHIIDCVGDHVIQGTLLLNNVTIRTDKAGCRLMATQTIFVNGPIKFANSASSENLQLSSARAIIMGFSPATLRDRLTVNKFDDSLPLTRGEGTNTEKNALILAEADGLGAGLLHDSEEAGSCTTKMVQYTADTGGDFVTKTKCSIEFERVLLNAPNIQSRYIGRFKGVVISEIALFAVGELNFEYDTTFDSVPILPVLKPQLHQ